MVIADGGVREKLERTNRVQQPMSLGTVYMYERTRKGVREPPRGSGRGMECLIRLKDNRIRRHQDLGESFLRACTNRKV